MRADTGSQSAGPPSAFTPRKRGRSHAEHGEALAVELDHAADDGRARAEAAPPQAVAQHDHGVSAELLVLRGREGERAAGGGADAQHVEVVAGHHLAEDLLGLPAAGEAEGDEDGARRRR